MSEAETHYIEAPDGVHLAYQIAGQGALGLLVMGGALIPIDLMREDPGFDRVARRLGRFSRTVWFDSRATGSSDGTIAERATPEILDADLTAVLDAAGFAQVALLASAAPGQTAIHFAVSNPQRVSALILFGSFAHYVRHHDYPYGWPADALASFTAATRASWGTAAALDTVAPSRARDEWFRQWWPRTVRLGASPDRVATGTQEAFERDYRPLLPAIKVPTLVLHRRGDRVIRVEAGRYLAEHIPGAKYVELPGDDHLFFVGDVDVWLDEVEEFLTGQHQPAEGDVALATVLFTDIVDSTAQEAALGHRAWTRLAEAHDSLVRRSLARHGGRVVKSLGDGFLATFDATTRAVRSAQEIVDQAADQGLDLRAGLHTGEIEIRAEDVAGLTVTIAKRICDLAGPRQVLISETVKGQLVGSGIAASERGMHVLKGVPDEWRLYAVAN